MIDDVDNPVVALCGAGMEREGTPEEARRLFEQAWEARRDDYDASIAAHFLARHQPTPADTLHWNAVAARHAEAVADGRTAPFLASLYLNLADSYHATGQLADARATAARAVECLGALPDDGYRSFIARGIAALQQRLDA